MHTSISPRFYVLFLLLFISNILFSNTAPNISIEENMTGKITFKVDMRGQTVSPQGVFIAGSFFSTIGETNWTFLPMCDLGTGIWQVSFCDVPPGNYQYKFVNGNSPPGWEFSGSGGPCTNPNDNNNRFVTVTGGVDVEGPWCWGTCDMFCNGMGDPGGSDTTPPIITETAPANTTIECGNPLPLGNPLMAADDCDINCTDETDIPVDDNSGLNSCGLGNVIRTWTATDCAGNTTTTTQTITIQDNTPPTIDAPIPADITVECGNLPAAQALNASDLCDNGLSSTGMPTDDQSGINSCGTGTIIRTWTATDCSGNSVTGSQMITVEDATDPVITNVPSDVTVECGNIPTANPLSASDNCDAALSSTGMPNDDNSGINNCGTGTIIRTWSVMDCSGNSVTQSQTITVEDTGNPTILGVPGDVTVECGNIPVGNAINASDACDTGVTMTNAPTDDNSGIGNCGTGTIIRTWSVTDCSGNSATGTQTITVEDATPPTISSTIPADITLECGDPLPTGTALTASDACDSGVSMTALPTDDNSGIGSCGTGIIVRSWSVADCAGNTTTVTQNITIEDSTSPMITGIVPPNVSLECGDLLPVGTSLSAMDSCDPNVSFTGMPTDDNSGLNSCGTGNIIRTWQATDCQNNSISVSQTITIQDNSPPTINGSVPADVTVECGNIPPASPLSASDDCDNSVSSTGMPTDDMSGINACGTGFILRTWEVADCVGNLTSTSQTITVVDNTPPIIFTPPQNVSVECGNLPPSSPLGATDLCDSGVFSTGMPTDDFSGINSCGTGTVIRTWSVTDCAGNTTTANQTITIFDSQPPTIIGVPPTQTIECTSNLPAGNILSASDNCDLTLSTSNFPMDDFSGVGACGTGTVIRTWTATDCSGNTATASQVFNLVDSTPPTIGSVPPSTVVECDNIPIGSPIPASDACDGSVVISNNPIDDNSGLNNCGLGNIIRTWSVTDCAGNTQTASQIITIEDNTPPQIDETVPQNITVECGNLPVGVPLAASDNCDSNITQTSTPTDDLSGLNNCGIGDLIRIWEVSDCAGNLTSVSQIITITDNTPPDISIPSDGNFDCNNLPSASANDASGTDNCSNVTITYDGEIIVGSGCPYEIHRTWTATDECGNSTSATQILTVQDFDLPIFLNTPSDTVVCEGTIPNMEDLTWEDGCDGMGTVAGMEVSDGNTNPEILTRTWSYADNCGNIVEHQQILTVTQSPTANAGEDQTTCAGGEVTISGSVVGGFSSIVWTTSGDGTFENINDETTTYQLGVNDSQNGTVTLTFTAQINSGDCTEAFDDMEISVAQSPIADAGIDTVLNCLNPSINLDGSGSSAGNQFIYEWIGDNFSSNELNPTISDTGLYILTVTDTSLGLFCSASDSVFIGQNFSEPIANAGNDLSINCSQSSVILDGSNSSSGDGFGYLWSGNGIIASNENVQNPQVSEPGIYMLTVTDSVNGCAATDTMQVILDGDLPTAEAGENAFLTCDNNTVILSSSGSDMGSEISYEWFSPFNTSLGTDSLQSVDQPGTYTLLVINSNNGCSATDTVEVINNVVIPQITFSETPTLTCIDSTNLVVAEISGLGPDYGLQWTFNGNPVGNSDSLIVEDAGIYQLGVIDLANNCINIGLVQVMEDTDAPIAEAGSDMMIDCNQSTVTLDGGNSSVGTEFEYKWSGNGINNMNDTLQSPVVSQSGVYLLTVTDTTNGCTAVDSTLVTFDGDLPEADAGENQILTCNNPIVSLNGGNSEIGLGISYQWISPSNQNLGTDTIQMVNESGIFTLVVNDNNSGCSSISTVEVINDISFPTIANKNIPFLNCADTTGTLEVMISGDTADIVYGWFKEGNSIGNTNAINISEPGLYSVLITDASNGCEVNDTIEVLQDILIPTANAGQDLVLNCLIDSVTLDGSNSSQGVDFIYSWLGSNFNSSQLNPQIGQADTYLLMVVDTNNFCQSTDSVLVTSDLNFPNADAGFDTVLTCANNSVLLDGSNSEQGNQIVYQWSNSAGVTVSNELTVQVSISDTYMLFVLDTLNGCAEIDEVFVDIDTIAPVAEAGQNLELNCIQTNVTLNGSGSSSGDEFDYLWTGNGLSGDVTSLNPATNQPGIYQLFVTNNVNGCVSEDLVSVTENTINPIAEIAGTDTLDCITDLVLLDGQNSSQGNTISYEWLFENQPLPNSNSFNWNANEPGMYILIVTNTENGCTESFSVEVESDLEIPIVQIDGQDILNCYQNQLTLEEVSGSTLPNVDIIWGTNNGNILNTNLNTSSIDLNAEGEYFVMVTDTENGCVGFDIVSIQADFELPEINLNSLFEIGCLDAEVELSASVTATTTNLGYEWSGVNFSSTQEMPIVSGEGDYNLIVTNIDNGCTGESNTFVNIKEGIESADFIFEDPSCFGFSDGVIRINNVSGGTPEFLFSINDAPFEINSEFENLSPGTYNIIIQDSEGCELEENINLSQPSDLSLELGGDIEINLGESVVLSPEYNLSVSIFNWSNSETLDCNNCESPIATPTQTTTYNLTIVSENGCEESDNITITVIKDASVFVPNVFSPNGDGVNDNFTIFASSQVLEVTQLMIFDRWGSPLFEANNINPNDETLGWNGKVNGEKMNAGTYVYWAEVQLKNGEKEILKGEFTLLR
jgi:gliding motility-associated-like protein